MKFNIKSVCLIFLSAFLVMSCTPVSKLPVIYGSELEKALNLGDEHYFYIHQTEVWNIDDYPIPVDKNFDIEEMFDALKRHQEIHGPHIYNEFTRSVSQTNRSFKFLVIPVVTQYVRLHYNVNYGEFTYKEELTLKKNKDGELVLEGYKVRK